MPTAACNLEGGSGTLGGTITFTLYGPHDATCCNAAIFTRPTPFPYTTLFRSTAISDPFTPSQAGTYRWRASYSGDTNNAATATACNDSGETSVVNEVAQTPGKVTGGGVINVTGGTANFGFVAQRKTTGGPASGNLNYLDHATKRHVHGPVTSLTITGNSAEFSGPCGSSCTFTVDVQDNAEPDGSGKDVFTIRITGSSPYMAGGPIRSGKIQVHNESRAPAQRNTVATGDGAGTFPSGPALTR